jgi:hypothetical protein
MPVRFETAGGHLFDLGHIRRQGGEELIIRLLEKAALPTAPLWRVQVQKKLMCNSETPPVRVVDEPKRWAIYLKIKPGDNNSCHYCSLLMPDGHVGPAVYPTLKQAAERLDRNWRHQVVETPGRQPPDAAWPHLDAEGRPAPVEAPAAALPPEAPITDPAAAAGAEAATGEGGEAVEEEMEDRACARPSGTARGWLGDPDKVRLLLLAIYEIDQEGTFPQDRFVEMLCQRLGWQGVNRYEVGGVFTTLVRRGYILRRMQGAKPYGYRLTAAGTAQIDDLTRPTGEGRVAAAPAASVAGLPAGDVVQALRSFTPIAQQIVEANQRLEKIAAREAELSEELQKLHQERDEITRFLSDAQVQTILSQLLKIGRPPA